MTVQEWLRLTISRLQARKNRARDSHQKASIGGQICMAHRALNIIEAHTIPATWHPINPADPATLPGRMMRMNVEWFGCRSLVTHRTA